MLPREVSVVDDMGVVATGKHGQSSVTIKVIIGSLVCRGVGTEKVGFSSGVQVSSIADHGRYGTHSSEIAISNLDRTSHPLGPSLFCG